VTKPDILIVSLGGTITMTRSEAGGITPSLDAADLMAGVPGLQDIAEIHPRSPLSLPSASLTLGHLVSVADLLNRELAGDFDGAVVVQGTDTIEETAFVLDLLVRARKPVVVTGAMRGADATGADGPANMLAAVITAASPQAAGLGTLVVLNDQIHAARYAAKQSTSLPSAFASPEAGPVGYVVEGRARILLRCEQRPLPEGALSDADAPVALHLPGLGDDGRVLGSLEGLGYRGLVIAGMGAGHVPAVQVAMLEELARSMPVVLASRVPSGPVFERTYGFAGSEMDLLAKGLIPAGSLSALKARLLLILLLMRGTGMQDIRQCFALYGNR